MSRPRKGVELLPIMAAAFPRTFFVDSEQGEPLLIGIDQDLLAALPAGIKPPGVKRFLHSYVNRMAYLRALLYGKARIDLTGAVGGQEPSGLGSAHHGNAVFRKSGAKQPIYQCVTWR